MKVKPAAGLPTVYTYWPATRERNMGVRVMLDEPDTVIVSINLPTIPPVIPIWPTVAFLFNALAKEALAGNPPSKFAISVSNHNTGSVPFQTNAILLNRI